MPGPAPAGTGPGVPRARRRAGRGPAGREAVTDRRGRTVYLKTFRLSESQARRGHLLDRLAAHDWYLARTAAALGVDEAHLGRRLESAGFGSLLRQDVLDGHRARARTR
ncbi:hypothetical protein ACIF70_06620 [Actinacidiphila glaucinigra]|uniref:hypothetical protein n=1 Tax=Actinacidiphila glaucinigra TaxID=235986 RepID=UPI0037C564D7